MYDQRYLKRLQKAGRISRFLKQKIIYPKLSKYTYGECLDYGCGDLTFLKYLKLNHQKLKLVGFDVNSHIYPLAKDLGIEFHSKTNSLSNKFNFIICDNVLEHIPNWKICLSDVVSRMDKNSTLIIGLPGIQGYSHDITHETFITDFDIQMFAEKFELKYIKRIWYPLNIEFFSNIAQLYSRHILCYHILIKRS